MKRSIWVRLIAMILVISMLAAPVSAATVRGSGHSTNGLIGSIIGIIKDIIIEIIDDWFDIPGVGDPDPTEPPVPTTPEEPTAPSEPVVTDPTEPEVTEPEETEPEVTEPEVTEPETPVFEQTLVEGHANTVNGNLLRGVTYSLTQLVAQEPQTAPYALRSTGYALNAVAEETTSITYTLTTGSPVSVLVPGAYVIVNTRSNKLVTNDPASAGAAAGSGNGLSLSGTIADTISANAVWEISGTNGSYTVKDQDGNYMTIGNNSAGVAAAATTISLNYSNTWTINQNGAYLNDFGGNGTCAAGWNGSGASTDPGSQFTLYAVTITKPEQPDQPVEPEQPETPVELIYYPVTMFNYDMDTFNTITQAMDGVDATHPYTEVALNGMYFSNGGSDLTWNETTTDVGIENYTDGQYYIQNMRAKDNDVNSWLYYNASGSNNRYINSTTQENATLWTLTNKGNNQVTLSFEKNGITYYMTVGDTTSGVTTTETLLTLVGYAHSNEGIQILGAEYLCQFGNGYATVFGGYEEPNDQGNGMSFYRVTDGVVSTTPVTTLSADVVFRGGHAAWNWWGYRSDGHSAQNKFYTGLVEDELVDGKIQFTVNEPGIFTYDKNALSVTNDGTKEIYQKVGLPFVKNDKGYYTFDSDAHGTYFADTDGDGNSDPWYGASDNYFNMFFDYQNTQGWADKSDPNSNLGYGDGSSNLWAPFNTNTNDTSERAIDYHLGMHADIPFSMTPNGCIKSTDNNSDHITFTFAGDDDVWIFIDGHLVIDLGGIHNRIGATIDFAANTITYFRPESNTTDLPIGSFNNPEKYPLNEDGTITVQLYNEGSTVGALGKTRTDFASQEEHTMSIFYLERGKGTSNCKIEFNLPMRDTLLVTKDATKSWSEDQDRIDGDRDGTVDLTEKEQAAVNNIPFGFTLYKKEANATVFTPVANTNYFVQDQKGVVVDSDHTDANGHFYLKNGETAKFMTNFPKEGVTYYVVEDETEEGFLTPDYKYGGRTTWGMEYYDSTKENAPVIEVDKGTDIPEHELPMDATENKSYVITVKGSIESIDSLEFICVNYLDETLPNPTAIANEDMIVIDYGLPVHIDPMANDIHRGDSIEIVAWGDESLTLNEVKDQYGNAVPHDADVQEKTSWSGTQNFHSGTVTFLDKPEDIAQYGRETFRYELNKQLTEVEVISYIIKVTSYQDENINGEHIDTKAVCRYALAKVYIAPATIMYYEENFSDMITFKDNAKYDANWGKTVLTSGNSDYQEDGVVGESSNHTYGTDEAYLTDSFDSNGTSRYGDTTNGAIQFSYTFTGTGTSIFARTSANTGYMQIKIYEGETASGAYMDVWYRDTYWKDENLTDLDKDGVLYNVPVYTNEDLEYGTYTVVCTIAKKGSPTDGNVAGAGNEFYLDGIRVMQPLNEMSKRDDLVEKALEAYTIDGESNLDVVTLRQKLITDAEDGEAVWNGTDFVVLTDINDTIVTAAEYTSIGPKEEVYLMPGQKVTFSLKYWEPEGLKLYAGMKAPFGSGKLNVGHDVYELKNAADCYYDVTDNSADLVTLYEQMCNDNGQLLFNDPEDKEVYLAEDGNFYYTKGNALVPEDTELTPKDDLNQPYFVVTYTFEATDKIVSLTNIKVVGSHEFTIIENTDINQ